MALCALMTGGIGGWVSIANDQVQTGTDSACRGAAFRSSFNRTWYLDSFQQVSAIQFNWPCALKEKADADSCAEPRVIHAAYQRQSTPTPSVAFATCKRHRGARRS